jgi:MoaD family protein
MKIKLFGGLRRQVGATELPASGTTVRDVLANLSAAHPELGEALFGESDGDLRPHIRIIINGVDSELSEGLDTPVREGDQIAIFPPIAGG